MDIRDIIKGKDLKVALRDLSTYVVDTFGKPSYITESSSMRLFSYPKYDISFRVDTISYELSLAIQSYDSRVNNYIKAAGVVYDFKEFRDAVEMLTEDDCAYKEARFEAVSG